jgi:hypothetical protein
VITAGINPASSTVAGSGSLKHDQPQVVNIPARGSSSDATKRTANPSPLSKPTMSTESAVTTKDTFASAVTAALNTNTPEKTNVSRPQSPATKQLAALNAKGGKKPSRLRRAFSFGSAAELRKASAETNPNHTEDAARLQTYQDDQEAEQARIARKQEEGGLGSGIYSGQGNFFSGSTDNLSISSTASSASIMIRKMGKGMKKSTRSLVGLFRPKSVIGVPAADSAVPQVSTAEVSMVNVEAERPQSNGNISVRDQSGVTSRQEPDTSSLEAPVNLGRASGSTDNVSIGSDSAHRRSIRGGDKERAEVLAAVKKGILKRSGTDSTSSSPVVLPVDHKTPNFGLPQIPSVDDSPPSSAPSTPNSDVHGHRRTESVTLNGEDYFMSALRFTGTVSKSSPATPAAKRNISWKNAANYHDTWASTEYDRRGEIATCNRLTPMLAQQIKEELNTFKMVRPLTSTTSIESVTNSISRKWKSTRRLKYIRTFSNDHHDYTKIGGVLCSTKAGNVFTSALFSFSQSQASHLFVIEFFFFFSIGHLRGVMGATERIQHLLSDFFTLPFLFYFLACIWMTSLTSSTHFVFLSLWFVLRLFFPVGGRPARKIHENRGRF